MGRLLWSRGCALVTVGRCGSIAVGWSLWISRCESIAVGPWLWVGYCGSAAMFNCCGFIAVDWSLWVGRCGLLWVGCHDSVARRLLWVSLFLSSFWWVALCQVMSLWVGRCDLIAADVFYTINDVFHESLVTQRRYSNFVLVKFGKDTTIQQSNAQRNQPPEPRERSRSRYQQEEPLLVLVGNPDPPALATQTLHQWDLQPKPF